MMIESANLYDGLATSYNRARPDYPPEALAALSACAGDLVADIGAGTGIFSRQLAQSLPDARVIGVEPGADMRRTAEAASLDFPNLSFVEGTAEALPFPDGSLALVTVATAAHWFDRPRFYPEALRCLRDGGHLAIVQNVRRWWDSAFLAEYEELHERNVPGYSRSSFPAAGGTYVKVDVAGELRQQAGATDVRELAFPWERRMTREVFVPFSLSSTITQRSIAAIGEPAYLAQLGQLLDRWSDASGQLSVLYVTTIAMATKAGNQGSSS